MRKIKTGIIGLGYLGYHHLRNIKKIEYFDIAGVYDIDSNRLKKVSNEFSVTPSKNVKELIEKSECVFIITPTQTHFELTKMALEMGKHCFVEKPLTFSLKEAEELANLSKEKNLILQTGYVERFNPAFLSVKQFIQEPLFIEAHRLTPFSGRGDDVSVVLDLMVHDIDLATYFINSTIRSISAIGIPIISNYIDIANARIEFENGATVNLTASRVSKEKIRKIRFFQRYSYISINLLEKYSEVYTLKKGDGKPEIVRDLLRGCNEEPIYLEDLAFAETILNKRKLEITPDEAKKSLHIATMILDKIRDNLRKI